MKPIRVAVIQTHWPGDRTDLMDAYRRLISNAAKHGANVVCLQEFSLSPYFASTLDQSGYDWAEPLHGGPSDQFFAQQALANQIYLIGSLFEKDEQDQYWDTATIHDPSGILIGHTRKVHIPQGDGYHEDHFFKGDSAYPIHQVAGVPTAVPTCYDQWFPEMSRICALNGAELICYPSAIGSEPTNPEIDSQTAWQTVMQGQAIANGVYIVAINRTGSEGVEFYGSSFICNPMGQIVAQASRDQTEVIFADLDPALFDEWRRLFPLLQQRRPDTYGKITE
ncbi:MAG: nitrilase-related carbon-nitrogen hydrolase [Chloroflexota bacterium]